MKPKFFGNPFLFAAAALALLGTHAHAVDGTWNTTLNGPSATYQWNTSANWTTSPAGGIPGDVAGSNVTLTANFTGSGGNENKINIATTSRTVGILTFGDTTNNDGKVSITTTLGATLTFDNGGAGAEFTNVGGFNNGVVISVFLKDNLTIKNNASTLLAWTGNTSASVAGNYTITNAGTGAQLRLNNPISNGSGTVSFTQNSANSYTEVLAAQTYTGTTTITTGTINLGGATAAGALSASSSIVNNGTLQIDRTNAIAQGTGFSNTISGTGVVNKTSGGAVTLTGTGNTYSGGFIWGNSASQSAGGGIILAASSVGGPGSITSGPLGTGTFTVRNNSATTANNFIQSNDGTARTISNAIVFAGSSINFNTTGTGNLIFDGTVDLGSGTRTINVANTGGSSTTFSGVISGSGGLTKGATGTLILSNAANTYSGNTTISGGTLRAGVANAIPSGSGKGNVVLDGGASAAGTFDINGLDVSINGLAGTTGTVLGKVLNNVAGTKTLTVGSNDATADFAGVIGGGTGVIALSKVGAGTQTLSGANVYQGNTTINGGTLAIGNVGALGSAGGGTVTVNGGTLALGAFNLTKNAIALDSGKLTGSAYSGIVNIGGVSAITGTYSGTVNAGTDASRAINTTGNLTVGTLNGEGTFSGGLVTVTGQHNPGNSPGTQTFNTGLAYNASTTVTMQITADGSLYDQIIVNNGLNLGGATLNVSLDGFADYTTGFWDIDRFFTLYVLDAPATGDFGAVSLTGLGSDPLEGTWTSNWYGNDYRAVWTAIPEPTAALLGSLGMLLLLRRRRA